METSLAHDVLVLQLKSQLRIEQARYKAQKAYSLNNNMIVESSITASVIEEIEIQIALLKINKAEDMFK